MEERKEGQEGGVRTDEDEDVFSDSIIDPAPSFRRSDSSSLPTTVSDGTSSCGSPLGTTQSSAGETFNYNTDALVDAILQPEKEFMDFILSSVENEPPQSKIVPSSVRKSSSSRSPAKVGLDHLDNLCKLMEQLSDLREANSKLRKRVQYLEDIKTIHDMHRDLHPDIPNVPEMPAKPQRSKTEPRGMNSKGVISLSTRRCGGLKKSKTQPSSKSRERSKSVGHEEELLECKGAVKKKFPKWSKVKEALGLEKIDYRQHGTKRGRLTKEYADGSRRILSRDIVGTLNIPVYTDYFENEDVSPAESYTSESMAGGGLNSPSVEDFHSICLEKNSKTGTKRPTAGSSRRTLAPSQDYIRRRKSTPSPTSIVREAVREELRLSEGLRLKCQTLESGVNPDQSKYEKEDTTKKPYKGPWGRMKTIIQTRRDSIKRRHKKTSNGAKTDGDPKSEISVEISAASDGEVDNAEEQRKENKRRSSDLACYSHQRRDGDTPDSFKSEESSQKIGRQKQTSSETGTTDSSQGTDRNKRGQKPRALKFTTDVEPHDLDLEDEPNTGTPTSPSFYRKLKWNKMKKVFGGKKEETTFSSRSVPSSPASVADGSTAFEFENIHYEDEYLDVPHSFSFSGNTSNHHEDERCGQMLFSSRSDPMETLVHELQSGLSDDFTKKIEEWERLRFSKVVRPQTPPKRRSKSDKSNRSNKGEEKQSKQRMKDLNWLEKELHKVEREKQRLAKEKQKYEEKACRLEKLRETVVNAKNTNRNEVFVKTSAGEFRFEGISDAFTKKLYEWETKRGVVPELSTLALLDASRQKPVSEKASLQRGHSRSETSLVEVTTGQPSQTSSNSLPSLKQQLEVRQGCPPGERPQPSRSNSVPDLSMFNGLSLRTKALDDSELLLQQQPYAPPEITRLIDSESEESHGGGRPSCSKMCTTETDDIPQQLNEDSYYSLVEENMLLLEQLKLKEEICRKLEYELVALDQKMAEMKRRHEEEMERYREKLWEVHRPGSKPHDLEGSLLLISELKRRIEELERSTERLKSDRQTLENSFRYHSEQQAKLAVDLTEKMRELQEASIANSVCSDSDRPSKQSEKIKWNPKKVQKLHDLSSALLQQAGHLEEALAERTHQVCHLRWELLNRDVSTMRLETELQRARWQSSSGFPTPSNLAHKYSQQRSWSSSDGLSIWNKHERPEDEWIQERLSRFSSVKYEKWPAVEYEPTQLSNTIHELKIELLQMSSPNGNESDAEERSDSQAISEQSESADLNRSFPSHTGTGRSSPVEIEVLDSLCSSPRGSAYQGGAPQITVRRNSADNFSSVSGPECSESSSLNENIAFVLRLPSRRWTRSPDNVSTSSESSFLEEEAFARSSWCSPRGRRRVTAHIFGEENTQPKFAATEDDTHSFKRLKLRRDGNRNSHRGRGGHGSDVVAVDLGSEYSSEELIMHSDDVSHQSCSGTGSPLSPLEGIRTFGDQEELSNFSISEDRVNEESQFEDEPRKSVSEKQSHCSEAIVLPDKSLSKMPQPKPELKKKYPIKEKFNFEIEAVEKISHHPKNETQKTSVKEEQGISLQSEQLQTKKEIQPKSSIKEITISSTLRSKNQDESSRANANHAITDSKKRIPFVLHTNTQNNDSKIQTAEIVLESTKEKDASSNIIQTPQISKKMQEPTASSDGDFKSFNISATTPIIKSRSPRRLKNDCQTKETNQKDAPVYGKVTIKTEQLDVKKPSAVMGSPLVKSLIQKYNQKAQEKTTDSTNTNNSGRTPLTKETNTESGKSPVSTTLSSQQQSKSLVQLPSSPLLAHRSEYLLKAKEEFIKKDFTAAVGAPIKETKQSKDEELGTISRIGDDDSRSVSSARSMDSASIVTYKTGELCRETRQAKKMPTAEDRTIPGGASSGSSETKLMGDQSKSKGFLNLKLRKSQKKKEASAVGQLCRQSLLLNLESPTGERPDLSPESSQPLNAKSCPSSPEVKVKSKAISGWFTKKSIFRR